MVVMSTLKVIQESLQVRFPSAKVSVKKATERAGIRVAYVATVRNTQSSAKDLPKVMIISFDANGSEMKSES